MKNFKIFIVEFNAIKVRQRIKEGKRKIKEISEKTTKCCSTRQNEKVKGTELLPMF